VSQCEHKLFQAMACVQVTEDEHGPMLDVSNGRRRYQVRLVCCGCDSYRIAYFLTDGTLKRLGPVRKSRPPVGPTATPTEET
jgi:hypothetical protein